jgi:hypothetical protein
MSPSKLRSNRGEGTVRLAIGISALLLGAWTVNLGFAQEASESSILLKLTEPVRPVPAETVTRDDLRELPTPRLDKLSEAGVTVTVIQGDPLCLPGDDPWRINSRPRPTRVR